MLGETPTNATETIVNIDEGNAARYLIEESMQRPVVIDFWADWCEPCKALMPVLEKLAAEYNGAFLLAKVNADEQQMITQQFGVRSLPTVMVMQNGQPVDGFAGAQPEKQVREMLEKYLPSPFEGMLAEAEDKLASGDTAAAVALLRTAYEDSDRRHDIAMPYAHALIEARRFDEAQALLDAVHPLDPGEPGAARTDRRAVQRRRPVPRGAGKPHVHPARGPRSQRRRDQESAAGHHSLPRQGRSAGRRVPAQAVQSAVLILRRRLPPPRLLRRRRFMSAPFRCGDLFSTPPAALRAATRVMSPGGGHPARLVDPVFQRRTGRSGALVLANYWR